MLYGPIPQQQLPDQNAEVSLILMGRFLRAAEAHRMWAEGATTCQNFFEGKQWTEQQIIEMKRLGNPIITLNKIAPLIRLVSGYQRNNRTDIWFLPENDGQALEDTADALNAITKSESNRVDLPYTDSEVFMDGCITGRGFWDWRLNFENNDFGDIEVTASDPFSKYIDPDCNTYDLNKSASYVQDSRWISVEEAEFGFGKPVANMLHDRLGNASSIIGNLWTAGAYDEEISPMRFFGNYNNFNQATFRDVYFYDFVDTYRKQIRLIDTQYAVWNWSRCFVDLDSGDFKEIPDAWADWQIERCLQYATERGSHLVVDWRRIKKIRWTVTCGDIIVHDNWSPYSSYTTIGFFPYFRRGQTIGMVSDLLDPQREINKRRSTIQNILNRNSNPGWKYHKTSLDPSQKEKLKTYGAMPGFNLEWQGEHAPERIEPGQYPQGQEHLESHYADDLKQISGINESAMGELDTVQSGRAIEARQRQAVIALQPYLDNFSRSKKLCGGKALELFQNHYTEPRIFRMLGEDGSQVRVEVNKKVMGEDGQTVLSVMNDITIGKYSVQIDETPMTATFQSAQFEEALSILSKMGPVGQTLLQIKPDLLVQMSTLPRKEEWIAAIKEALSAMAQAKGTPPQGGQPDAGGPQGAPQGAAPPTSMPSAPTPQNDVAPWPGAAPMMNQVRTTEQGQ